MHVAGAMPGYVVQVGGRGRQLRHLILHLWTSTADLDLNEAITEIYDCSPITRNIPYPSNI